MNVTLYRNLEELSPEFDAVFAGGAGESFYLSRAWFQTLINSTMSSADELRLYGAFRDNPPQADGLLIMSHSPPASIFSPRSLLGVSNFYTMNFAPVIRAFSDHDAIIGAMINAIAKETTPPDVLHFRALDQTSSDFAALVAALQSHGFWTQTYFHFGNQYEVVINDTIDTYMQRRPSRLLNTIRRKEKKLGKFKNSTYHFSNGDDNIEKHIDEYQKIHAQSWKPVEHCPLFIPELMRKAASLNALRLGFIYIDGMPAATQLWLVWKGKATIYKLSHDKRFDELSIGSILTRRMMQAVLEQDQVEEVDFGRGDDPYKALWMSQRRERWGIMAFNRRTIRGRVEAARHFGGRQAKSLVGRFIHFGRRAGAARYCACSPH
jgi:hypothetical protein